MDLTVNSLNTKPNINNKVPSFKGKIYGCGLNKYQVYACQKIFPELKKIMRWRLCDLNIINNKTIIFTFDSNKTADVYCFTKLQLQNKVTQNVVAEKDIALSPYQAEDIIKTVKELFKIKGKKL